MRNIRDTTDRALQQSSEDICGQARCPSTASMMSVAASLALEVEVDNKVCHAVFSVKATIISKLQRRRGGLLRQQVSRPRSSNVREFSSINLLYALFVVCAGSSTHSHTLTSLRARGLTSAVSTASWVHSCSFSTVGCVQDNNQATSRHHCVDLGRWGYQLWVWKLQRSFESDGRELVAKSVLVLLKYKKLTSIMFRARTPT